jgi:hypothetical protein
MPQRGLHVFLITRRLFTAGTHHLIMTSKYGATGMQALLPERYPDTTPGSCWALFPRADSKRHSPGQMGWLAGAQVHAMHAAPLARAVHAAAQPSGVGCRVIPRWRSL